MSINIVLSLLVSLLGLVLYYVSTRPKVSMTGLVAFGVGLLVFLQQTGSFHIGIPAR